MCLKEGATYDLLRAVKSGDTATARECITKGAAMEVS